MAAKLVMATPNRIEWNWSTVAAVAAVAAAAAAIVVT